MTLLILYARCRNFLLFFPFSSPLLPYLFVFSFLPYPILFLRLGVTLQKCMLFQPCFSLCRLQNRANRATESRGVNTYFILSKSNEYRLLSLVHSSPCTPSLLPPPSLHPPSSYYSLFLLLLLLLLLISNFFSFSLCSVMNISSLPLPLVLSLESFTYFLF